MSPALRAGAIALLASVAFVPALAPHRADASVSRAILFEELVRDAKSVDVVTPTEQHAVWENGRIYTYSRVRVDRAVAGELASGSDAWVRTMGGVVDKIGQVVDGEPALAVGQPTLLFLRSGPTGAMEVTARAQGQFAVLAPKEATGVVTLAQSGAVGVLVASLKPWKTYAPQTSLRSMATVKDAFAADVLHERPMDEAVADIAVAWKRAHAK